jgi:hypothetical protein
VFFKSFRKPLKPFRNALVRPFLTDPLEVHAKLPPHGNYSTAGEFMNQMKRCDTSKY